MEQKIDIQYTDVDRQPRDKWYAVHKVARSLVRSVEKAGGLDIRNLVYFGGYAAYLHLRSAIGARAATHWRGTEDLDLIVFEHGGANRLVRTIERRGSFDAVITSESSRHLPDKASCAVLLPPSGNLTRRDREIELDVYSLNRFTGTVHLNHRELRGYPDIFVTEPVQFHKSGIGLSELEIAIPSVVDCLILKFDIVGYSLSGLRQKDQVDVLSLFLAAEAEGRDPSELVNTVLSNVDERFLSATIKEFRKCLSRGYRVLEGCDNCDAEVYAPSRDYLIEVSKSLSSWKSK